MLYNEKTYAYDMTAAERLTVLREAESSYKQSMNWTRNVRQRWYLVERYLEGLQWGVDGAGVTNYLSAFQFSDANMPQDYSDKVLVDNLMLRIYMTNIARVVRYKPSIDVIPDGKDEAAQNSARMSRIFLNDMFERMDFNEFMKRTARYLMVYGKSFTKVTFNPKIGKMVKWPTAQNPMTGEWIYRDKPEGDVDFEAISPKNLTFPVNCQDLKSADWVQEVTTRTTEWVFRNYGVTVKPEKLAPLQTEGYFNKNYSFNSTFKEGETNADGDMVLVKERWYRACPRYPKGAIIVWASGRLLRSSSLLDYYDDIPYYDADFIYIDGSIWADTVFYHIIKLQDELNKTESDVAIHNAIMARPKGLVNREANVSAEAFTDENDEIIEWSGPGHMKPEYLAAPELPNSVYEQINRLVDRMMSIGFAHDIIRPNRARSGNAIAFEQEIDETTLQPMMMDIQKMLSNASSCALGVAEDYIKIPRLVKMFDQQAWQITKDFKGSDIGGSHHAKIDLQAGLPAHKMAKQQLIMQAVDKGVLDPRKAAKFLEFPDSDDAFRDMSMDYEVAQRSADMMEAGVNVPVHEWDNHEVCAEVYTRRMRDKFNAWPDEVKTMFNYVLALHNEWLKLEAHPANSLDMGGPSTPAMLDKRGIPPMPAKPMATPNKASGAMPPEGGGSSSRQEPGQQPERETLSIRGGAV
jgi:hypothetical protein